MTAGRARLALVGALLAAGPTVVLPAAAATAAADPTPIGSPTPVGSPTLVESFEAAAALPAGWRLSEYRPGTSSATIVDGPAADGAHFLRISSPEPNHARVLFPVTLAAATAYRFHAAARAGAVGAGTAAVLGVDGQYTVTDSVRTEDRWQELDLYVAPGPAATVELSLGLGHFGQLNTGVADFDAVQVSRVDAVPAGAVVAQLAPPAPATPQPTSAAALPGPAGPSPLLWLFVGVLAAAGSGIAVVLRRNGQAG